ncbi:sigma-70 family RNA polymerase sigma factor [Isoptericola sp. QY 916]|uniref:sigma-70 family RNA polymerase sigma factor n=1 Tax=Isoptericola sp. QY 916 TaxID=2782570 RepID=UPI003D2FF6A7|nr:sigma-70 family RNA polymerase sigma factor [Isoptericola sp. QY 916]
MTTSDKLPRREDEAFRAVVSGLAPFIVDGEIEWDAYRAVAESVGASAQVRKRLETVIAEAGLLLRGRPDRGEDDPAPGLDLDLDRGQRSGDDVVADAIAAARHVMQSDRRRARPENFILTAREEVGLALILRGDAGQPLESGEFGRLTGERGEAAICLFLHNQRLVHSIAQRYGVVGLAYEDVFQHGAVGLVRAVEMFDPQQGTKFSTYATWWVRQSITRGIANESRLIRLPVHMVERVNKVWATRDRLTVDGDPPRVRELAAACGLDEGQILECLKLGRPQDLVSLDMPVSDSSEATLGDLLALADSGPNPAEQIDLEMLKLQLQRVMELLTERERGIISMRFGFRTGESMTLDEIGRFYGLTRERIRQIEKKVMERLRESDVRDVLRPYM